MLTIHGHPLNSSAAIRAVIEDMRKTVADPTMKLDMAWFANQDGDVCHACAGGSAVIHGMGANRMFERWTTDQRMVASYYDEVRCGYWLGCDIDGYPIPESPQDAWSKEMLDAGHPDFFPAWERFADAVEAAESS